MKNIDPRHHLGARATFESNEEQDKLTMTLLEPPANNYSYCTVVKKIALGKD